MAEVPKYVLQSPNRYRMKVGMSDIPDNSKLVVSLPPLPGNQEYNFVMMDNGGVHVVISEKLEVMESDFVVYCDLVELGQSIDGYWLWCRDHNRIARHVAKDGDTRVCEEHVKVNGCNCCK